MKIERTFCVLLFILTIVSIMFAGCTSKSPEPAPANLPTTAHEARTPVPVETSLPATEKTTVPEITPTEEFTALTAASVPDAPADMSLYEEGGFSISYPDRFSPISDSSLEKMRTVAQPQGIDILTILTANDSKDSIQVTKQVAESSIEGIYNEKMAISNEVTLNGSVDVKSMRFVKYDVEKQMLADGTGVVKVTAENSDNGTAVTCLLYNAGTTYNINFIYENPERAGTQESVRDAVMRTIHLA